MASTLTRRMKPRHLRATKAVGYALTLADHGGWFAASALFAVHLKPAELADLAVAALDALDEDAFNLVLDFVEGEA